MEAFITRGVNGHGPWAVGEREGTSATTWSDRELTEKKESGRVRLEFLSKRQDGEMERKEKGCVTVAQFR